MCNFQSNSFQVKFSYNQFLLNNIISKDFRSNNIDNECTYFLEIDRKSHNKEKIPHSNINSDFGKISSNLINEDKRIQFLSFEANSQLKRNESNLKRINLKEINFKKPTEYELKMKFKTELCKFWEFSNQCKFKDNCAFAHGPNDLRLKCNNSNNFKIKKCVNFFEFGACTYGSRCQFLHACNDTNKLISKINSIYFKMGSYKEKLEQYSSDLVKEDETCNMKRRLIIFEKIVTDEKFDDPNNSTMDLEI